MKAEVKFKNGKSIVHFLGIHQHDLSLCGDDLVGDSGPGILNGGYEKARSTKKKVNCRFCLEIVRECKSIPDNEL